MKALKLAMLATFLLCLLLAVMLSCGDDDDDDNDDNDDDATDCAEEGELALDSESGECCEGLTPIECAEIDEQTGDCIYADCGWICAQCGNGECGIAENECNCPEDCG